MKITEVLGQKPFSSALDIPVVGLDIGSRASKGVLIKGDEIVTVLVPTGLYTQETADEILAELLRLTGLERKHIGRLVGTGYGRVALEFKDIPFEVITEIKCHAMGAHFLNAKVKSIVDIGGQDSKAIKVDTRNGKVVEFIMNDKCAAGTGRFLEKAANLLGLTVEELGQAALNADKPSDISSQCVVFAESELISLNARGERRENIAAGIHLATARRVKNLVNRLGLEPDLVFSGGVSNNIGMWKALEDLLGHPISVVKLDTVYAGALGAAILAQRSLAGEEFAEKLRPGKISSLATSTSLN